MSELISLKAVEFEGIITVVSPNCWKYEDVWYTRKTL